MLIKILKDEYLFSNAGTHICDDKGIAIKASEDVDCDVAEEHAERVIALIIADRAERGLGPDGLPVPEPIVEEAAIQEPPVEEPSIAEET